MSRNPPEIPPGKFSENQICEEIWDSYEPTEEDIFRYAETLGIDVDKEQNLLFIAKAGLKKPLPPEWKPCWDAVHQRWYYYNLKTFVSSWIHPSDTELRNLVKSLRHRADFESNEGKLHNLKQLDCKEDDMAVRFQPPRRLSPIAPLKPVLPPTLRSLSRSQSASIDKFGSSIPSEVAPASGILRSAGFGEASKGKSVRFQLSNSSSPPSGDPLSLDGDVLGRFAGLHDAEDLSDEEKEESEDDERSENRLNVLITPKSVTSEASDLRPYSISQKSPMPPSSANSNDRIKEERPILPGRRLTPLKSSRDLQAGESIAVADKRDSEKVDSSTLQRNRLTAGSHALVTSKGSISTPQQPQMASIEEEKEGIQKQETNNFASKQDKSKEEAIRQQGRSEISDYDKQKQKRMKFEDELDERERFQSNEKRDIIPIQKKKEPTIYKNSQEDGKTSRISGAVTYNEEQVELEGKRMHALWSQRFEGLEEEMKEELKMQKQAYHKMTHEFQMQLNKEISAWRENCERERQTKLTEMQTEMRKRQEMMEKELRKQHEVHLLDVRNKFLQQFQDEIQQLEQGLERQLQEELSKKIQSYDEQNQQALRDISSHLEDKFLHRLHEMQKISSHQETTQVEVSSLKETAVPHDTKQPTALAVDNKTCDPHVSEMERLNNLEKELQHLREQMQGISVTDLRDLSKQLARAEQKSDRYQQKYDDIKSKLLGLKESVLTAQVKRKTQKQSEEFAASPLPSTLDDSSVDAGRLYETSEDGSLFDFGVSPVSVKKVDNQGERKSGGTKGNPVKEVQEASGCIKRSFWEEMLQDGTLHRAEAFLQKQMRLGLTTDGVLASTKKQANLLRSLVETHGNYGKGDQAWHRDLKNRKEHESSFSDAASGSSGVSSFEDPIPTRERAAGLSALRSLEVYSIISQLDHIIHKQRASDRSLSHNSKDHGFCPFEGFEGEHRNFLKDDSMPHKILPPSKDIVTALTGQAWTQDRFRGSAYRLQRSGSHPALHLLTKESSSASDSSVGFKRMPSQAPLVSSSWLQDKSIRERIAQHKKWLQGHATKLT